MTNRELRRVLLEDLDITKQALSQRVKKLKKQFPMTTEDATYIIAHQQGIILDKYLNSGEIAKIGEITKHLQMTSQDNARVSSPKGEKNLKVITNTIQIAKEFNISDPILSGVKIEQAKEMASIYPLLYILENSIRELIDIKMIKLHDENWWDSYSTRKLRESVAGRMLGENKNSWHQRRGARPIDYLDLNQLVPLMRNIENDVVPDIIPSLEWFSQLIEEVYQSRCVLCHMNPLDNDSITSVKLRFRQWQKQIKAKIDQLSKDD